VLKLFRVSRIGQDEAGGIPKESDAEEDLLAPH